jgi:chromosome segregation ATPase
MKIKTETISTIALVLACFVILILLYKLNNSTSDYREELKRLKIENKSLREGRDLLSKNILILEDEFSTLKKKEMQILVRLRKTEKELSEYKDIAQISEDQLLNMRSEMKETEEKIREFRENPPNRVGQDLIISLRNKTSNN